LEPKGKEKRRRELNLLRPKEIVFEGCLQSVRLRED